MARVSSPTLVSQCGWERKNWSAAATEPSALRLSNLAAELSTAGVAGVPVAADPGQGGEAAGETARHLSCAVRGGRAWSAGLLRPCRAATAAEEESWSQVS